METQTKRRSKPRPVKDLYFTVGSESDWVDPEGKSIPDDGKAQGRIVYRGVVSLGDARLLETRWFDAHDEGIEAAEALLVRKMQNLLCT